MKIRINENDYLVPGEIYEDIQVKDGDDTTVEFIPVGEASWIDHSHGWDTGEAAIYIDDFISYTGSVPTFDFLAYKYKLVTGELTEEASGMPGFSEIPPWDE